MDWVLGEKIEDFSDTQPGYCEKCEGHDFNKKTIESKEILDIIDGKPVLIKYIRRIYKCKTCGARVEPESRYRRIDSATDAFKDFIADCVLSEWGNTYEEVSEKIHKSTVTVKNYVDSYIQKIHEIELTYNKCDLLFLQSFYYGNVERCLVWGLNLSEENERFILKILPEYSLKEISTFFSDTRAKQPDYFDDIETVFCCDKKEIISYLKEDGTAEVGLTWKCILERIRELRMQLSGHDTVYQNNLRNLFLNSHVSTFDTDYSKWLSALPENCSACFDDFNNWKTEYYDEIVTSLGYEDRALFLQELDNAVIDKSFDLMAKEAQRRRMSFDIFVYKVLYLIYHGLLKSQLQAKALLSSHDTPAAFHYIHDFDYRQGIHNYSVSFKDVLELFKQGLGIDI